MAPPPAEANRAEMDVEGTTRRRRLPAPRGTRSRSGYRGHARARHAHPTDARLSERHGRRARTTQRRRGGRSLRRRRRRAHALRKKSRAARHGTCGAGHSGRRSTGTRGSVGHYFRPRRNRRGRRREGARVHPRRAKSRDASVSTYSGRGARGPRGVLLCIPGFRPPDDFRLTAPAHWAEVLGQTFRRVCVSTVLVSKAFEVLDDNPRTFDEVRDEVNRLARARGSSLSSWTGAWGAVCRTAPRRTTTATSAGRSTL